MKDAFNLNCLPIVQDEMKGMAVKTSANKGISNISNGYYGYYQLLPEKTEDDNEQMETQTHEMDVLMHGNNENSWENKICRFDNVHLRLAYRKRAWEYSSSDAPEFKKRREIGWCFFTIISVLSRVVCCSINCISDVSMIPTPKTVITFRHPTHNLPDVSRCMMGHYV